MAGNTGGGNTGRFAYEAERKSGVERGWLYVHSRYELVNVAATRVEAERSRSEQHRACA